MKRDPTRRVIEKFQELMGGQHVSEVKDDPDVVNPNKDTGTMIAEIRPILLNASEAAKELSPSRAMCGNVPADVEIGREALPTLSR